MVAEGEERGRRRDQADHRLPSLRRLSFFSYSWSPSQVPRDVAYSNARFEQTILEYQPQPFSAMAMIAAEPILLVQGRKAVCDGGESWLLSFCG